MFSFPKLLRLSGQVVDDANTGFWVVEIYTAIQADHNLLVIYC